MNVPTVVPPLFVTRKLKPIFKGRLFMYLFANRAHLYWNSLL
jgi:hypothetical protein